MTRLKLLAAIGCAALATAGFAQVREAFNMPRLTWVATAHQFGPVSYRDPAGAISPDGKWIAYSEGRFLRIRPVSGGAGVDFEPGTAQIRALTWKGDSTSVVADGSATPTLWARYDRTTRTREPYSITASGNRNVRQPAWSGDGTRMVGVSDGINGNQLDLVNGDTVVSTPIAAQIASPAFVPDGRVACIARQNGRLRLTLPCGAAPLASHPDRDAYGPVAFSPDGAQAYVALGNPRGTVDLWSIPVNGGEPRQLTSFDRDSYAPSVAADGSVLFKVQSYRTHVAIAAATGGPTQTLATFQSETPSWDPVGKLLGITYGTWRRLPDDAKYPDIAQDAGIIGVDPAHPAAAPSSIVHDSMSEDQSLCWSPDGQWIAFHSHKDMSDDIWLRRAAGDATAKRITMLGRGAEAGWPRWSRNGRWLLFNAASKTARRTVLYVVGMNQVSGEVTEPAREIVLDGLSLDVFHGEWLDDGDSIVAVGKEGPGRHVIFTAPRSGGAVKVAHRFASEHDIPGLGASPDGKTVAFIAPAGDGFFQVFRLPLAGGSPSQVTSDPTNKTQPAWSPDGQRIAFTVWSYDAQFWRLVP
jgi:Tol biopolymer transport system component